MQHGSRQAGEGRSEPLRLAEEPRQRVIRVPAARATPEAEVRVVPQAREEFSLAWWSFLPIVLMVLLVITGLMLKPELVGAGTSMMGKVMLVMLGMAFWFLVFAGLAFAVYRLAGRSKMAGSATFAALPMVFIVVVSALALTRVRGGGAEQAKAAVSTPSEDVRRFNKAMLDDDHEGLLKALYDIERDGLAREQRSGETEKLRGKVQRTWSQRTRDMLTSYHAAVLPLRDESFHDLALLKQDGDYERRVELLEKARAANKRYGEEANAMNVWVKNEFGKAGGEGYNARKEFEDGDASRRIAALHRVRELDDEIFAAMQQRLLLLQRNGPWWRYESSTDKVLFEDMRTLEQFETIQGRITYFVEEQKKAQKEALEGR